MRIIGIDPGLNATGFGVIEHNKSGSKLIAAGVVRTSVKELIQDRLNKIYNGISEIIRQEKPEVLVLEKVFSHYKHPTTAISLGYARGIICLVSGRAEIPIKSYAAKRVKKAITGRGDAQKQQVQRMVQHLLSIKEEKMPFDLSDALALALAYTYLDKIEGGRR
ncbi:MAG: crossover junction endodeoxyribonuclease RuvC [Candidatus Omnitrophica bacterium]|nr:crossover junction endodeoxyribonuclease RuvC [Candidatus Omnitrophota bacterium]